MMSQPRRGEWVGRHGLIAVEVSTGWLVDAVFDDKQARSVLCGAALAI